MGAGGFGFLMGDRRSEFTVVSGCATVAWG